jgi:hypothetical protein
MREAQANERSDKMSKHSCGGYPITGRTGYRGKHEKTCEYRIPFAHGLHNISCDEIAAYQSERHNDVLCLTHANDVVRQSGEPVRAL